MEFEFDENKSKINQEKHGVDFVEAQQLWIDPNRIELLAKTEDEPRFMLIGKIGDKHWSAIITYRQTKIRLISVRRSRTNEVNLYES
ncbi:BrnT family toxin [Kamptonema sp. UHCC 0994]|uniref:BrnT family toxin n=1 Tax=Kamptonema sp. UHCC 0994 TaxID=3031329 RepID=UPI0023B8A8C1|nr:BrnT family toxin [Kamptonema sp. UHCC 0994]MDF0555733.1 BrnT family toxin [Kamptonema sp. UHCC 0994]